METLARPNLQWNSSIDSMSFYHFDTATERILDTVFVRPDGTAVCAQGNFMSLAAAKLAVETAIEQGRSRAQAGDEEWTAYMRRSRELCNKIVESENEMRAEARKDDGFIGSCPTCGQTFHP